MGKVAVLFRLMPRGVDTDLRAVQRALAGAVPAGISNGTQPTAHWLAARLRTSPSDGLRTSLWIAVAWLPSGKTTEKLAVFGPSSEPRVPAQT